MIKHHETFDDVYSTHEFNMNLLRGFVSPIASVVHKIRSTDLKILKFKTFQMDRKGPKHARI